MNKRIYIYIFLVFSILIISISMLPIFNITSVNVVGNRLVPTNDILRDADLVAINSNIFLYPKSKYEKSLKKNPYFEDANIKRILPNSIVIEISERILSSYVLYKNNTFLYMDNNFIVMDTKQNFTENRPIIKGIEFDSFTVGKALNVKNVEALESAKTITKTINRYEDLPENITIDVKDTSNIHIYVNNINVVFGDAQNCDLKVRRMLAAISAVDSELKGYLYVDDVNRDAYFKIIT